MFFAQFGSGGERNRFHAINLCEGTATITGITNDLGFNSIFKEQLKYQAEKDDILFCISGSGNSGNVIEAMKYAKDIGMKLDAFNLILKGKKEIDSTFIKKAVSIWPIKISDFVNTLPLFFIFLSDIVNKSKSKI